MPTEDQQRKQAVEMAKAVIALQGVTTLIILSTFQDRELVSKLSEAVGKVSLLSGEALVAGLGAE